MGQEAYIIQYNSVPNIERASRKTIGSYLDHEKAEWLSFLAELPTLAGQLTFQVGQVNHDGISLAGSLDQLGKLFDDVGKFNSFSRASFWPAAGLVDTEIRCFHLSESRNAEKEVQPRVQA